MVPMKPSTAAASPAIAKGSTGCCVPSVGCAVPMSRHIPKRGQPSGATAFAWHAEPEPLTLSMLELRGSYVWSASIPVMTYRQGGDTGMPGCSGDKDMAELRVPILKVSMGTPGIVLPGFSQTNGLIILHGGQGALHAPHSRQVY